MKFLSQMAPQAPRHAVQKKTFWLTEMNSHGNKIDENALED